MKKKLALGLALVLACGTLAGCGGSSEEGKDSAESGATTAKVIDVDLTDEEYAFGVDKDQPELLEQANAFIAKVLEDGTLTRSATSISATASRKQCSLQSWILPRISLW